MKSGKSQNTPEDMNLGKKLLRWGVLVKMGMNNSEWDMIRIYYTNI